MTSKLKRTYSKTHGTSTIVFSSDLIVVRLNPDSMNGVSHAWIL